MRTKLPRRFWFASKLSELFFWVRPKLAIWKVLAKYRLLFRTELDWILVQEDSEMSENVSLNVLVLVQANSNMKWGTNFSKNFHGQIGHCPKWQYLGLLHHGKSVATVEALKIKISSISDIDGWPALAKKMVALPQCAPNRPKHAQKFSQKYRYLPGIPANPKFKSGFFNLGIRVSVVNAHWTPCEYSCTVSSHLSI